VLQPLLLGRAVKLHPLAVVLAISAGLVVGGIAGALLAVPLLAVLNSGIRSLIGMTEEEARSATVDPHDPEESRPEGTGRATEPREGSRSGDAAREARPPEGSDAEG
jgi:hypothetical protein